MPPLSESASLESATKQHELSYSVPRAMLNGVESLKPNVRLRAPQSAAGFTLLEIASVMVILGILGSLCMPLVKGFKGRAEGLKCASNMKGLGVGVQAYMADYGHWPQIANTERGRGLKSAPVSEATQNFAKQWIETLKPYGIAEATWHCPSVERQIRQQGKKEAVSASRIDYTPTVFDSKQDSPTRWPKHPWFVERGALHGTGPNVLFADGSVSNLGELMKWAQ